MLGVTVLSRHGSYQLVQLNWSINSPFWLFCFVSTRPFDALFSFSVHSKSSGSAMPANAWLWLWLYTLQHFLRSYAKGCECAIWWTYTLVIVALRWLVNSCLKLMCVDELTSGSGNKFHSLIVLGEKEFLYNSLSLPLGVEMLYCCYDELDERLAWETLTLEWQPGQMLLCTRELV